MYASKIRNEWTGETPEEEWNFHFNNKRVSIEALESIELKKKGKGPIKPLYNSPNLSHGPYYDPGGVHVHIWKKDSLIDNFIGEQKETVPHVQFKDYKKGTYCCICHQSSQRFHMKWRNEPDSMQIKLGESPEVKKYYNKLEKSAEPIFENPETPKVTVSRYTKKWHSILYKVKYSLNNDKIVYKISDYKSLLLWPWELTPYQKFKLNKPDYKKSGIFIKSKMEEFRNNYAIIK